MPRLSTFKIALIPALFRWERGRVYFFRKWLFLSILFFLSGCASVAPTLPVTHQSQASRAKALQSLTSWQVEGKIGIQQANKGESASFIWQQNHQNYDLRLMGPLGAGAVRVEGSPLGVRLIDNQGQVTQAKSASRLISAKTGWNIPVENLFYWIRGLALPKGMSASGWKIQYLEYTSVNGIDLPARILLTKDELSIKIVIKSWNLS